jgi:hypothetical protein
MAKRRGRKPTTPSEKRRAAKQTLHVAAAEMLDALEGIDLNRARDAAADADLDCVADLNRLDTALDKMTERVEAILRRTAAEVKRPREREK